MAEPQGYKHLECCASCPFSYITSINEAQCRKHKMAVSPYGICPDHPEATKEEPDDEPEIVMFHGACLGCVNQLVHPAGVDFCINCQNFNCDWNKPDLWCSSKGPNKANSIRETLIKKYDLPHQKWRAR